MPGRHTRQQSRHSIIHLTQQTSSGWYVPCHLVLVALMVQREITGSRRCVCQKVGHHKIWIWGQMELMFEACENLKIYKLFGIPWCMHIHDILSKVNKMLQNHFSWWTGQHDVFDLVVEICVCTPCAIKLGPLCFLSITFPNVGQF